nr:hypothetical protein [Tanacetum cinerariifolium]
MQAARPSASSDCNDVSSNKAAMAIAILWLQGNRFIGTIAFTWFNRKSSDLNLFLGAVVGRMYYAKQGGCVNSVPNSVLKKVVMDLVTILLGLNVFHPDHVDDLPEVEPNQPDLAPAIFDPTLVDENEEPKEEEEFKEEDPQEEEEDMESEDVVEDEDMVEPEDEMVVHFECLSKSVLMRTLECPLDRNGRPRIKGTSSSLGEFDSTRLGVSKSFLLEQNTRSGFSKGVNSGRGGFQPERLAQVRLLLFQDKCVCETTHALVKKKGKAKDKYCGKLISDLGNEVRSSVEEGTTTLENLVRNFGNAEERVECKKLKKDLEEA